MKFLPKHFGFIRNQHGVSAILVAVLMVVFLSVAALAVDIGHLAVVRNELKNAADAGAVAGARFLYNHDGTAVNPLANQFGHDAAEANRSEKMPAEVDWTGGNSGDVQRGHWSFGIGSLAKGFYPNASLLPVDLWGATTQELDENLNFINAVKVTARRETSPAASFFARIMGYQSLPAKAEAVAYIGFAGTLKPFEVNEPIAICEQALLLDGKYTCGVGRMINSGADIGHQTGGWTNFDQPCSTANPNNLRPLICGQGNPEPITLGVGIGTQGGMDQSVYYTAGNQPSLMDCWRSQAPSLDSNGNPTAPWNMVLPVIECPGNNVGPCSVVVGSVQLNVVWITKSGAKQFNDLTQIPKQMAGIPDATPPISNWVAPSGTPQVIWQDFVDHFKLKDVLSNSAATLEDKTIYFLPDCSVVRPRGQTGGKNFNILAEYPKLVE